MTYAYSGLFQLLASTPWVVTVIVIYTFTELAIWFARQTQEGIGYQVSWTAKVGFSALFGLVGYGIWTLQNQAASIPSILQSSNVQMTTLFVLVIVCIIYSGYTVSQGLRSGYIADVYNDIVITPVMLFLLAMLVPVIVLNNGVWGYLLVIAAFIIWLGTLMIDIRNHTLDQRLYIARWADKGVRDMSIYDI